MEITSFIFSIISVVFSIITYFVAVKYEKRKSTIEAIHLLQNEVLDKFVSIKKDNAVLIVENLNNEKCREAYNDYRALIARIEHFAEGVNSGIYDFKIVKNLLGRHFICLYDKVAPIINKTNENASDGLNYYNITNLIKKLKVKLENKRSRRTLKNGTFKM